MDGSGLLEAIATFLAENSAENALHGHAFSRAVRAHLLVQLALANIIFSLLELTDVEKIELDDLLQNLGSDDFVTELGKAKYTSIKKKLKKK